MYCSTASVQVGLFDHPVLELPSALGALLGLVTASRIKSCIRGVFLVMVVAIFLRSAWTEQQPDVTLAKLVQYLMDLESRQIHLWHGMEDRIVTAIHCLRRRRSSLDDCDGTINAIQEGCDHKAAVKDRVANGTVRKIPPTQNATGMERPEILSTGRGRTSKSDTHQHRNTSAEDLPRNQQVCLDNWQQPLMSSCYLGMKVMKYRTRKPYAVAP